jgi:stage V sporulation protein S
VSQADVLINQDDVTIRVRPTSPTQQIANSIRIAIFEEHQLPILRAIGAGAVAQACKGIAVARGYVATQGFDLGVNIGFANVISDKGEEISAQTFHLFLR